MYIGGVMGLRFGEAVALRPVDLDLLVAELTISRTVTEQDGRLEIGSPKTKASLRTLVIPGPLVDELSAHVIRLAIEEEGLLFSDGRVVRSGGVTSHDECSHLRFRAGLDGLTFHGLRHSAATQWVADGIDARTVQHWLGHSDPRLVLRLYAHASTVADRHAAEISSRSYWG